MNFIKNNVIIAGFIFFMFLISCIDEPSKPIEQALNTPQLTGSLILCEGLWGQDNSSITYYGSKSDLLINDYFSKLNPGLRLGDIGNDIQIRNGIAYVVVTTSATIISVDIKTGKFLGKLQFKDSKRAPRKMTFINDSLAAVTDLYSHSISVINYGKLEVVIDKLQVGPAPEGIFCSGNYIFVANSGYGDYLADKPKAGSISIIDLNSKSEIRTIYVGPNLIELLLDERKSRFYAAYYHLPSKSDSVGGIVEFDLLSLKELRRWSTSVRSLTLGRNNSELLFIDKNGVSSISLSDNGKDIVNIIKNPSKLDNWYSLAFNPDDKSIWIGNAKNFTINGEIRIYSDSNYIQPSKSFVCGINPGRIVFY